MPVEVPEHGGLCPSVAEVVARNRYVPGPNPDNGRRTAHETGAGGRQEHGNLGAAITGVIRRHWHVPGDALRDGGAATDVPGAVGWTPHSENGAAGADVVAGHGHAGSIDLGRATIDEGWVCGCAT
jgi:hypothetical protein